MAEDDVGGVSDENDGLMAQSLLPYDRWIEESYRQVMVRALNFAATEGLPDGHHFYITFRTDDPLTVVPKRMLAQYPAEMTIVLQHQFWDLKVDPETDTLSVGLSFGSVPTTLAVPLRAITAFADPHVRLALRFSGATAPQAEPEAGLVPAATPVQPATDETGPEPDATPQVVSLDAFRKRSNPT